MNQTTPFACAVAALLTVGTVTVQPAAAEQSSRPHSPAVAEVPQDGEDQRREAAAAARARARYQAEVRWRETPADTRRREATAARARSDAETPHQAQPQRVEQPRTQRPSLSRPPYHPRRQPSQLGVLLRAAGQVARTIERAERGRFNLPRELHRAGRMIDRHQRR